MKRIRLTRFQRLVKHGYDPTIILGTGHVVLRKKFNTGKSFTSIRKAHLHVFGY